MENTRVTALHAQCGVCSAYLYLYARARLRTEGQTRRPTCRAKKKTAAPKSGTGLPMTSGTELSKDFAGLSTMLEMLEMLETGHTKGMEEAIGD